MKFGASMMSKFSEMEDAGATNLPKLARSKRSKRSFCSLPGAAELLETSLDISAMSSNERLSRNRERNRVHAQKTRQRKKEQMQTLQVRAEELKEEQIRLKQIINEKNTATILVCLFARSARDDTSSAEDPQVEDLLRRPLDDIPDASKIPELPALILPGQHVSKKVKARGIIVDPPDDGIDYDLLGRDRSQCTPEELDKIRRERNRMHAKRTRDRKRLFIENLGAICTQLEEENNRLQNHLAKIDPDYKYVAPKLSTSLTYHSSSSQCSTPSLSSPNIQATEHPGFTGLSIDLSSQPVDKLSFDHHMSALLLAAKQNLAEVSETDEPVEPLCKRQRSEDFALLSA